MNSPETIVSDSPVRFEQALAYALHPDMRRLIILYIVGVLMTPVGMAWFLDPPTLPLFGWIVGLSLAIVGAIFLFGGLVGTLFKLVTDATLVARAAETEE